MTGWEITPKTPQKSQKFPQKRTNLKVLDLTSVVDSEVGTGSLTPVNLLLHFPGETGVGQHRPRHLLTQLWRFELVLIVHNINSLEI